jgi:hypothetical protein
MIDLDSEEAWLRHEVSAMDTKGASVSLERVGLETDKPAIRLVFEWKGAVAALVLWGTGEWDVERVGDEEGYNFYGYSEVPSRDAIWRALDDMVRDFRPLS